MLHCHILKLLSSKSLVLKKSHALNWKAYWGLSEHDSLTPYLEICHVSVLKCTDECSLKHLCIRP